MRIALARFRLKMKMKQELKKCLFYKVIRIDDFYEARMKKTEKIVLPILFMIKKVDSPIK